jgi:plasmid stability protein
VIWITQFADFDSATGEWGLPTPEMQALLAVLALLAHRCYARFMATIVIRNLDETIKRRLQVRAALNGRSMEAEARELLAISVAQMSIEFAEPGTGNAIHELFAPLGGVDLRMPSGNRKSAKSRK